MNIRDFIDQVGQSFTAKEAAGLLSMSPLQTAKVLHKWMKAGWLQRQSRGIYTIIPLSQYHQSIDNPWAIISKILKGCEYYVCGFSACEYFGLTEQIFNDISVATCTSLARQSVQFSSGKFMFFTTKKDRAFGTKIVWIGNEKIPVSDIHKTIVDIVVNPAWGGGIVHVFDCLKNYLKHEEADLNKIMEYGEKLDIGTFFKRLGFYLEHILESDNEVIKRCHARITRGYSYLSPTVKGNRYIASWRLIVPEGLNLGGNE